MKRIFSKMDKPLLFVTIVFFLFGLLMILSASSMESYIRYENSPYNYFYRQGAFLILGLIASILIIRIPTKVYKGFSYLLLIGIITLIAMSIMGVKYAVLLGVIIGVFNIIPYFGAIIAIGGTILITILTGGINQAIAVAITLIALTNRQQYN